MHHGREAPVCFVGAHRDAFELLEIAEEIFDQMVPFIHFQIDGDRRVEARMLRNHDHGATCVEIGDDRVAVERLVGDQRAEVNAFDQQREPTGSNRCPGGVHTSLATRRR